MRLATTLVVTSCELSSSRSERLDRAPMRSSRPVLRAHRGEVGLAAIGRHAGTQDGCRVVQRGMKRSELLPPVWLVAGFVLVAVFGMALCGPRPQPSQGEGWRLLWQARDIGSAEDLPDLRAQVATSPDELATWWRVSHNEGELPDVDFESEIALGFATGHGGNCPIILADVVFDQEGRKVYADFARKTRQMGCNDDFNPIAFVVAVERTSLPDAPFKVQLNEDADSQEWNRAGILNVITDLREPGSTADDSEMRYGGS